MYFNDKSDTNIDSELGKNGDNKLLMLFNKYSKWIIIGIIALIILIILIVILSNRTSYYITLEGDSIINIYQGDKYDEPGYKGYDNKKNDLTDEVVVDDSKVDTSKTGEYTIKYSLHRTTRIRTINVIEKPAEATNLYLKGDLVIKLKVGEEYIEPGWVAIDTFESDLNDKVQVDSNVDTSKEGTYLIIYRVKNSKGVTTSTTRTVIVSN